MFLLGFATSFVFTASLFAAAHEYDRRARARARARIRLPAPRRLVRVEPPDRPI